MKIILRTCIFALCLLRVLLIYGQTESKNYLGQVNIASPNSASLGKYVDIPVNYHTGIPNISIPIYNLSVGQLSLPIGLNYHAGGLRVDESASWVGAGWSLNAGGVITRVVKDKPDERKANNENQDYGYFSDYGLSTVHEAGLSVSQYTELYDSEPDLFSFNFNGYSGQFYFNDDRTPMVIPEQDLKIEYVYPSGPWTNSPGLWGSTLGRCIESFIITTPDGTKYYFGIPDTGVESPYCDPIEVTSTFSINIGGLYSQVISSWYLYKVESPDANSIIQLNYEREKYAYHVFSNPIHPHVSGCTQLWYSYNLVKNYTAGVRLRTITAGDTKIDFIPGNVREDISSWGVIQTILDEVQTQSGNPNRALGSVQVSAGSNNCLKKFDFNYGYFVDNSNQPVHSNFSSLQTDKKRLRLESVKETSCDGTSIVIPPYTFDYLFPNDVPRRFSFGRDHWGFSNGIKTNQDLYPPMTTSTGNNYGNFSANRESVWPAMSAGTLSKITYPTGGSTSFEFEPNTVAIEAIPGVSASKVNKTVGGLRINKITQFDPVSQTNKITNFSYLVPNSTLTSGILFSRPTYIQVFRNDWFGISNTFSPSSNGCHSDVPDNLISNRPLLYSDNPLRPMETTQGNHMGYKFVRVTGEGSSGYSEYEYYADPLPNNSSIAITTVPNPGTCDLTIPNYPPAPISKNFFRGELHFQRDYLQNNQILKEVELLPNFSANNITTPGIVFYNYATCGGSSSTPFTAETTYEIYTAKKTWVIKREKLFQQDGSYIMNESATYYESPNHSEPTRTLSYSSTGETIEQKIKYAFDFKTFNITQPVFPSSNFMAHYNAVLYGSPGYINDFNTCFGYASPCFDPLTTAFRNSLWQDRKNFVNWRRINYTNPNSVSKTNQANFKAAANEDLKTLLWMQDINMNSPVEITNWNNGNVVSANLIKYNNLRGDAFGVYPSKTQKIDLGQSVSNFTASSVSGDKKDLVTDSRYTDLASVEFNKGRIINTTDRAGIISAYAWGYNNNFPILKTANASNKRREVLIEGDFEEKVPVTYTCNTAPCNNVITSSGFFSQTQTYSIPISISNGAPNNFQITHEVTLKKVLNTVPVSYQNIETKTLCVANPTNQNCNTISAVFENIPAGDYILSSNTSFNSTYTIPVGSEFEISFHFYGKKIIETDGSEFFSENFEESTVPNVITGAAHTGIKFWNTGTYTVPFTKPNTRDYLIQWWSKNGSDWVFNQETYTGSKTLSGQIDDVRIFPSDAQMTTYTYDPLKGMTSEMDLNGRTIYYDYDALGRLMYIRDKDGNILKKYEYKYQQQGNPAGTCNTTNCSGADKKCINGFCERSRRINTSTVLMLTGVNAGKWRCVYHYEFSDGSRFPVGSNIVDFNDVPCDVMQ